MKNSNFSNEFPSILDKAYHQYKRYQKVIDIMSREVIMIGPDETIADAAKIMGEKHIGSLIVEKYRTPIGIITERDLLSNVLALEKDPKKIKVEKEMSYPLISICPTIQIREAAQIMIKKRGRLAVFECGNLVGIITASDLIRSLPEAPETIMKVDEYMSKDVVIMDEKTTIDNVVKIMGKKRIGSVIISKKGKSIGIFTERDLITTFLAKGKSLSIPVGEACSSPLITAQIGISIREATNIMSSKHIKRLPLFDKDKLVGIITARDLVEAYAK